MPTIGRLHNRVARGLMTIAILDIGGGFTKNVEIAEPIPVYNLMSPGPMPKVVRFRLQHYDEASNTAYYKVEEVTNGRR